MNSSRTSPTSRRSTKITDWTGPTPTPIEYAPALSKAEQLAAHDADTAHQPITAYPLAVSTNPNAAQQHERAIETLAAMLQKATGTSAEAADKAARLAYPVLLAGLPDETPRRTGRSAGRRKTGK